jgi:hypothetical protein
MSVMLGDPVIYSLITPAGALDLSSFVGKHFTVRATGRLTCILCGREVRKFYGQGMCFPCLQNAPEASECIVRPELCRAHVGEGRDPDWEIAHHATEHIVYLSRTSSATATSTGIKVGVTRSTQVPARWIDQGAVAAIPIARVPYRQLAGQIEVDLKRSLADRTDWRGMLRSVVPDANDLSTLRDSLPQILNGSLLPYLVLDEEPTIMHYPVLGYPAKCTSVQLAKTPEVSGRLVGIKGQYLIWEDGRVLNVRNHCGYHVTVECTPIVTLFEAAPL